MLFLAACGGGVTKMTSEEASVPVVADRRAYACGVVPFEASALEGPANAEEGNDQAAEVLRDALRREPLRSLPERGWREVARTAEHVLYLASEGGDEPPLPHVRLGRSESAWELVDYGACEPLVVAEELHPATWTFEGDPPAPDTTTFEVLVTETACVGGRSVEDRLRPPIVSENNESVVITFLAAPPPGGQGGSCIGNTPTEASVNLSEPVGDRVLRDGAVYPPRRPRGQGNDP